MLGGGDVKGPCIVNITTAAQETLEVTIFMPKKCEAYMSATQYHPVANGIADYPIYEKNTFS